MSHRNGHKTWSLVIKSTKQSNPTLCTEHIPSLLSTQRVRSKQAQLEQRVEGVQEGAAKFKRYTANGCQACIAQIKFLTWPSITFCAVTTGV